MAKTLEEKGRKQLQAERCRKPRSSSARDHLISVHKKQAGIGQGLTLLWIWEGGNGGFLGMPEWILDAPSRQKSMPERRYDARPVSQAV
jgi:hypothetical protein